MPDHPPGSGPHASTLALHRYRYGELAPGDRAALAAHLEECPGCRERLRAQDAARRAFELEPPPAWSRTRPPDRRPLLWGGLAAALATTAALLLLVRPPLPPTPTERTKGASPAVELWRATAAGPEEVPPDAPLAPGDRIQVRYRSPGSGWVALAGRDGAGRVEVYGAWPAPAPAGRRVALPVALVLDDAPGPEQFLLVAAPGRLEREQVAAWVRTGRFPEEVEVVRIAREKRSP